MSTKKNRVSQGLSVGVRRTIAYTTLILVTFLCLFWFYVLFVNATRTHADIQLGFSAIPGKNLITNWTNLITGTLPIWKGLGNSVFIAVCQCVLTIYFSAMTAYGIHAYTFKGKKFLYTFILMVMMIPSQVTAQGFLQMIGKMGLQNSFIPLIVPSIASPVTFFYMKQNLEASLPLSIVEAARIDGASEVRTFNTIVLPMIKPALAVQAIFSFVGSWNNYFIPALLLTDDDKKTLPILIAQLRSAEWLKFDMGQVYIMIAFSIFPVIVVYLFLSRYIVSGITLGGVKG